MCLLSACCACIQAQQAAGSGHGSSPAQPGPATAAIGTKRKRKLEAVPRCALGVARMGGAAPHQAAAEEERERKRLRAALLCVRAAAAGCTSIDHARLPGGQPCPAHSRKCTVHECLSRGNAVPAEVGMVICCVQPCSIFADSWLECAVACCTEESLQSSGKTSQCVLLLASMWD